MRFIRYSVELALLIMATYFIGKYMAITNDRMKFIILCIVIFPFTTSLVYVESMRWMRRYKKYINDR